MDSGGRKGRDRGGLGGEGSGRGGFGVGRCGHVDLIPGLVAGVLTIGRQMDSNLIVTRFNPNINCNKARPLLFTKYFSQFSVLYSIPRS